MSRSGEPPAEAGVAAPVAPPFSLLTALAGDPAMADVFSERATIEAWLAVEVALARVQAETGVISPAHAQAIERAATWEAVDPDRLWRAAANTGYPIVGLLEAVGAALPEEARGRLHYGATTQDIMDSGLALQLDRALARLDMLLVALGDAAAEHVEAHATTVMAGRTHAQQAVPTTFGLKLAGFLAEVGRHRQRMREARPRVAVVSLFGAAGTGAALGSDVALIRRGLADALGLHDAAVSWHVARDGVAEFGAVSSAAAATAARLAREVVDLSRTELGEVAERSGPGRGASSTMPQKANPITSEAVIGVAAIAAALAPALLRAMQPGHERAAGEWQIEWFAVPHVACAAAGALAGAVDILEGLQVFPARMRENLDFDSGLIMAEAWMIDLAPAFGRDVAYAGVREAVARARAEGVPLAEAIEQVFAGKRNGVSLTPPAPDTYIGEAEDVCRTALEDWRRDCSSEPEGRSRPPSLVHSRPGRPAAAAAGEGRT